MIKNKLKTIIPISIKKFSVNSPLVLTFHGFEDNIFTNNLYKSVKADDFQRILNFLLKNFKPITDLSVESISKARGSDFLITFDDGLLSSYETAKETLKKLSIPAIYFINRDFLNQEKRFYRFDCSLLCNKLSMLDKNQLTRLSKKLEVGTLDANLIRKKILSLKYYDKEMLDQLFSIANVERDNYQNLFMNENHIYDLIKTGNMIGSHSCDHPKYSDISLSEQITQTLSCSEYLTNRFKLDYSYFAFPFNAHNITEEFYCATKNFIDLYFTTSGWRNRKCENVIHRVGFDSDISSNSFNHLDTLNTISLQWNPLKL